MTDEQGRTDNNSYMQRRKRAGFGHGPLAGTRIERLAWIVRLLIEKETGEVAHWIPNPTAPKHPYGGLYPSETALNPSTMINPMDDGSVYLLVSVGPPNRQSWIDRLHAAGYTQATTRDGGYPGKVELVLNDPLDLADETVRVFISEPWRIGKGNK